MSVVIKHTSTNDRLCNYAASSRTSLPAFVVVAELVARDIPVTRNLRSRSLRCLRNPNRPSGRTLPTKVDPRSPSQNNLLFAPLLKTPFLPPCVHDTQWAKSSTTSPQSSLSSSRSRRCSGLQLRLWAGLGTLMFRRRGSEGLFISMGPTKVRILLFTALHGVELMVSDASMVRRPFWFRYMAFALSINYAEYLLICAAFVTQDVRP